MNSLKIDTSRDSISSIQGEDSHRSSTATLNRSLNRLNNKKITVDKRTFNKLVNFLTTVIKELNLNLEEFKEITMLTECVQTDYVNITSQEEENKEEIILEYKHQIEELEHKLVKFRRELEEIKNKNHLLLEENNRFKEKIQIHINENQIIQEENLKLLSNVENLKNEMETIKSQKNYKFINRRFIDENSQEFLKDDNSRSESNNEIDVKKNCLSSTKIIKNISDYLNPCEYLLFSHTNRIIQNILQKDSSLINQLKKSIESKNYQISNLLSFDWNKEYDIKDVEIERLIKEYLQINKIPGIDLKNLLVNALNYIKNDIKKTLGIVSHSQLEPEIQPKKSTKFLDSLNSVFNKFVNKKEAIKNKKSISPGSFENISDYDNYLVTDFSNNYPLNVEFNLNSSEEIKTLLVTFFASFRNNPQSISNFIAELINEYSDFVFYAYRTLIEIKEMEIVKNAMHERFRKYYKICSELENELEDLKKFAKTNKEIKDILLRQKQEIEVKYTDCITQITYLKDELNTTEKYERIEQEYETFKVKLVKEYKFLKGELDAAQSERSVLKEALFEFKKYFMRFHLTDDGDIQYVEDLVN